MRHVLASNLLVIFLGLTIIGYLDLSASQTVEINNVR